MSSLDTVLVDPQLLALAVTAVFTVISTLAIVAGVFIAGRELIHQTQLRRTDIALRFLAIFLDENFGARYLRVRDWQFRSLKQFKRAKGHARNEADWLHIVSFFETVAMLNEMKVADTEFLRRLMLGPIRRAWERTEPVTRGYRDESGDGGIGSMFEDLYKRLAASSVVN
jgi:hypothetical protein